ncbi:GNAT family N-acetyltransferase [Litoribacterium kuwaitense]|uniref:GNAT family N-acetyltransferase n=1 Tax=Litoribacterium kuwaitense TaxID=1398745 RepID=UPI0024837FBA|nr:GNAT family N-acetyltransferase [Litoribacterium kuwaitense]
MKAGYGFRDERMTLGMDQFIGEPNYWDRGIGQAFMNFMLKRLTKEFGTFRVVVDPRIQNQRAIACYLKSGFTKRKELPQHELHEGVWEDCVLMSVEV